LKTNEVVVARNAEMSGGDSLYSNYISRLITGFITVRSSESYVTIQENYIFNHVRRIWIQSRLEARDRSMSVQRRTTWWRTEFVDNSLA